MKHHEVCRTRMRWMGALCAEIEQWRSFLSSAGGRRAMTKLQVARAEMDLEEQECVGGEKEVDLSEEEVKVMFRRG